MAKDIARYLEIEQDIRSRIARGDWLPGKRIPHERELQVSYGCSRMTVNKALSALARSGVLQRKRRLGSIVATPSAQHSILEIVDIKAEVQASGRDYRFDILGRSRRLSGSDDRERLNVDHAMDVLAVTVLHCADDAPFAHEERLVSLAEAPQAGDQTFEHDPPGTWLLGAVPWTDAQHIISADAASREMARRLSLKAGAPCLIVERRTWRAGRIVTWVRLTYPAQAHRLESRFSVRDGLAA